MLDFYPRISAGYRWLDANEKPRVILTFGFFLLVHLTVVTSVTFLIDE